MNLMLEDIADITQGSILTRIKDAKGILFSAFTMQQLSYYNNACDSPGSYNEVIVNKERINNLCLAKENDIIVGLASGKAMKVTKQEEGYLILSNFIRIRIKELDKCNPDFLCWIFNENIDTQRYFASLNQGTARVSIIPLSFIKCMNIELIPIDIQRKIGRIYQLQNNKIKIFLNKEKIKSGIIRKKLLEIYNNQNLEDKEK